MSKKIWPLYLPLLLTLAACTFAFLWQRSLHEGQAPELWQPDVTPRAQAEFESGAISRAYRAVSLHELEQDPPIEKVMRWMSEHPREALR